MFSIFQYKDQDFLPPLNMLTMFKYWKHYHWVDERAPSTTMRAALACTLTGLHSRKCRPNASDENARVCQLRAPFACGLPSLPPAPRVVVARRLKLRKTQNPPTLWRNLNYARMG